MLILKCISLGVGPLLGGFGGELGAASGCPANISACWSVDPGLPGAWAPLGLAGYRFSIIYLRYIL